MPTDGVKFFPLGIKAMFLNIHQRIYNPIFKSIAFQSLPYLYMSVPEKYSNGYCDINLLAAWILIKA